LKDGRKKRDCSGSRAWGIYGHDVRTWEKGVQRARAWEKGVHDVRLEERAKRVVPGGSSATMMERYRARDCWTCRRRW
jgi:hypothetical protein